MKVERSTPSSPVLSVRWVSFFLEGVGSTHPQSVFSCWLTKAKNSSYNVSMSLSPEINDTIIDFLHNDKPSLCACCLTCKQWVSSSRFHLFSKITVTPVRIGSLLLSLESASTDIASMVRKLVIEEF